MKKLEPRENSDVNQRIKRHKSGKAILLATALACTTILGGCGGMGSVPSHQETVVLVKSVTLNSNGTGARYEYEYNAQGNPTNIETYDSNGNLTLVEKIEYDKAGRVLKYQALEGQNKKVSTQYSAVYDRDGNIKEENLKSENDSDRIIHEYDKNGIRRKIEHYGKDDKKEWLYSSEEYDDRGNKIGENKYDSDGTLLSRKETEYDDSGNRTLIKEYWGDLIANEESYEYDKNGWMIKHEVISGGKKTHWDEHEFDNSGNETRSMYYGPDGNLESGSETEYDDNGNKIKIVRYGENGVTSSVFETQYDDCGNGIKSVKYDQGGNVESYSEYEYDGQGHVLKSIDYGSDGSVNKTVEYMYDGDGHVISLIRLSYDENGNGVSELTMEKEIVELMVTIPDKSYSEYLPKWDGILLWNP